MSIFLRLIALITVIVLFVLAIGYCLPRGYSLDASIEIEASPKVIFPMINELPNWQSWSNFSEERIESLKITYGPKRIGEEASQTWQDSRGNGKLWITKSVLNESIQYDLKFGNFPIMESEIKLVPNDSFTKVTWKSDGSLPSGSFYGYFALLFPGQMNFEYQQALLRLKNEIEK